MFLAMRNNPILQVLEEIRNTCITFYNFGVFYRASSLPLCQHWAYVNAAKCSQINSILCSFVAGKEKQRKTGKEVPPLMMVRPGKAQVWRAEMQVPKTLNCGKCAQGPACTARCCRSPASNPEIHFP